MTGEAEFAVARELYAAFQAGDEERIEAVLAPDAEWHNAPEAIERPVSGVVARRSWTWWRGCRRRGATATTCVSTCSTPVRRWASTSSWKSAGAAAAWAVLPDHG